MTEKVTIGYNEWIITTFTHEQKIISVPYVSYFFLKRYNWNVNTHLELSRIFFLQFSVYDIFFWLKDSISKSLTAFQGFISYGANNFIHEFFIQEEEPPIATVF